MNDIPLTDINGTLENVGTVITSITSWFTDAVTVFFNSELIIPVAFAMFLAVTAFAAGLLRLRSGRRGRR